MICWISSLLLEFIKRTLMQAGNSVHYLTIHQLCNRNTGPMHPLDLPASSSPRIFIRSVCMDPNDNVMGKQPEILRSRTVDNSDMCLTTWDVWNPSVNRGIWNKTNPKPGSGQQQKSNQSFKNRLSCMPSLESYRAWNWYLNPPFWVWNLRPQKNAPKIHLP